MKLLMVFLLSLFFASVGQAADFTLGPWISNSWHVIGADVAEECPNYSKSILQKSPHIFEFGFIEPDPGVPNDPANPSYMVLGRGDNITVVIRCMLPLTMVTFMAAGDRENVTLDRLQTVLNDISQSFLNEANFQVYKASLQGAAD